VGTQLIWTWPTGRTGLSMDSGKRSQASLWRSQYPLQG